MCFKMLSMILVVVLFGIGGTQVHFDRCIWLVVAAFQSVAFGEWLLNFDGALSLVSSFWFMIASSRCLLSL